jgi:hypothetical protein
MLLRVAAALLVRGRHGDDDIDREFPAQDEGGGGFTDGRQARPVTPMLELIEEFPDLAAFVFELGMAESIVADKGTRQGVKIQCHPLHGAHHFQ